MKIERYEDPDPDCAFACTAKMRAPLWLMKLIFGRKSVAALQDRQKLAPTARIERTVFSLGFCDLTATFGGE